MPASQSGKSEFRPTANWENLKLRAESLTRLRDFFRDRRFLEVETPLLCADVAIDRHIEPFRVEDDFTGRDVPYAAERNAQSLWLQTSPEFAMKRLVAAGAGAIYQVTRSFRRGERGRLHNPEFTIVEWYRRGDDMTEGMRFLSELIAALLGCGEAERVSYRDAFRRHADIDPFVADFEVLAKTAVKYGIAIPEGIGRDRDDWLDLLLGQQVAPNLGSQEPLILFDYPPSQAALARVRDDDPPVAERFELFFRGIELANGYHELLDADELRERNRAANVQRRVAGQAELPEDSRLLAAMDAGLPPMTGVALGFDRLVMLATGAKTIDEVLTFPIERA